MQWFLAKIIFQIVSGDGDHQPQFDEQLRLITAESRQEALLKAQRIGACEEDQFLNQQQEWVQWQFINVAELIQAGALEDGMELSYQITEPEDAGQYIRKIHLKAKDISCQLSDPL